MLVARVLRSYLNFSKHYNLEIFVYGTLNNIEMNLAV